MFFFIFHKRVDKIAGAQIFVSSKIVELLPLLYYTFMLVASNKINFLINSFLIKKLCILSSK